MLDAGELLWEEVPEERRGNTFNFSVTICRHCICAFLTGLEILTVNLKMCFLYF